MTSDNGSDTESCDSVDFDDSDSDAEDMSEVARKEA